MINLIRNKLLNLELLSKQILMMSFDLFLLITISFFSFYLRLNEIKFILDLKYFFILLIPIISIPIFIRYGLYRETIRFININFILQIFKAVTVYSLVWGIVVFLLGLNILPRSVILIQWLFSLIFISISRLLIREFLIQSFDKYSSNTSKFQNILVYGAGSAGIQLSSSIQYNDKYNLVGFIDDNKKITNKRISGINVYHSEDIKRLINKLKVKQIFIAIPSLNKKRKEIIINRINKFDVTVKIVPGLNQITDKNVRIEDLKEVNIEDLLGRDQIKPDQKLMYKAINEKNILITGAGGSIGSQICKEIIKYEPSFIVLYDLSEFSLFQIFNELTNLNLNKSKTKIEAVIGDIRNYSLIKKNFEKYNINTVYHAAAYKHVPLIENNIVEGVSNNILGVYRCLKAAIQSDVENFVLISTDKAVRPTNVMGATKRVGELIMQDLANRKILNGKKIYTQLSAVRFGNVLGSSGSVVPIFNSQIKNGGPITVTDNNIIRYFMTIQEAAQLVIQAGSMGKNGEIFLLDMGEPVKIIDLANKMIELSGLEIKNRKNPDGDIEIIETGLRQGEKLFEELLIDGDSESTINPRIFKERENLVSCENLESTIEELELLIRNHDKEKILSFLKNQVPENKINKQ